MLEIKTNKPEKERALRKFDEHIIDAMFHIQNSHLTKEQKEKINQAFQQAMNIYWEIVP